MICRNGSRYQPRFDALEDRALPSILGGMELAPAPHRPDLDVAPPAHHQAVGEHTHTHAPKHHARFDAHSGGNQGNPGVLPPDSHAYGKTYGEWSAAWWQYALSIPADKSPFLDQTGANFAVGQSGHVWYLSGTFCLNANGQPCPPSMPATVVRNVELHAGKPLFFPILNAEADNLNPATGKEDLGFTVDQLRAQAKAFTDDAIGNMTTTVDGRPIQNLEQYRAVSPVFSYTLPANNIIGVPGPLTVHTAVADGFYLMLAPLSVGQHTVHFTGAAPNFNFGLDVTYNITVTSDR
jgi:hypothetical protein